MRPFESFWPLRFLGADVGRVLIGMQVPAREMNMFHKFLATLGYRHWDESKNPAYRMFLGQT